MSAIDMAWHTFHFLWLYVLLTIFFLSETTGMGAIFLWSYVYNIIRMSSTESTGTEESGCPVSTSSHGETSKLLPDPENSMPESILTKGWSEPEQIADQGAEHPTISDDFFRQLKMPLTFDGKKLLKTVSAKCDLRKVLAPSTIGVIVGFAVGLIPQIRKALIGELAPLHVIQDSASLLSDGAIPSVTLIMGGNLMKGIRRSDIRFSLVAGIIVARFIVLPVLGILIVKGAVHFGLVHGDPLYQFILLLQFAVPPALNIGIIKRECVRKLKTSSRQPGDKLTATDKFPTVTEVKILFFTFFLLRVAELGVQR
ncbi:hypothetical protein ACLOJK_036235 [Asimina triloba]